MDHTSEGWTEGHQQASEPDFYGKWIKCSVEMPLAGYWYLAFSVGGVEILFYDGENEHGIHWLKNGDWEYDVTHWSELPENPST